MRLDSWGPRHRQRAITLGIGALAVALHARSAPGQRPDQLHLASAPDHYFSAGGQRFRYREIGRGDPVILLHGRARTLEDNWSWMGDSLALTHRVIALDQRGHGKSSKPESTSDYGLAMATDVVALLDHLRIQRAHVVGFSLGAVVAAHVALRGDSRVRTVSLLAGPFYVDSASAAEATAQFVADMESGLGYRGTFRRRGLSDSAVEATNSRMMSTSTAAALIAVTRSLAQLAIPRERASTATVPALVAVGTADELFENNRQIASWWPGARLLELPGVNHGGVERSHEVLIALREHLRARR
jgi:pimeloyl-ACP methyl ester carboxylesterase